MPVSSAPYKPSTGALSLPTTSIGFIGFSAVGAPISWPYQATPAFTPGLCAVYSQVMRPPQQKPVMPSLAVSPPLALAHATVASRSAITCASGTLPTTSLTSLLISPYDCASPCRTKSSGAIAR